MSIMSTIKEFFGFFTTPTPEIHHGGDECGEDTYVGVRIGNSEYYVVVSGYNFNHPENQYKYQIKVDIDVKRVPHGTNKVIPLYSCSLNKNIFKKTFDRSPDEAYNSLLNKLVLQTKKHFKQHPEEACMVELLESYELYIQNDVLKIEKR